MLVCATVTAAQGKKLREEIMRSIIRVLLLMALAWLNPAIAQNNVCNCKG